MKIKVCGIKEQDNLIAISALEVDMIGLNFFEESKRFIRGSLDVDGIAKTKVGVFINADISYIQVMSDKYGLQYVQLHGGESVEYCRKVQKFCSVIKVFSVDEDFDFNKTEKFGFCEMFLFDTKCKEYGGSGQKFDWKKLKEYKGDIPFLLAGGIGPDDVEKIKSIQHKQLYAVDINSKFEIEPGIKEVTKVKNFIQELKK